MFHVYVTVFQFVKDRDGIVINVDDTVICKDLPLNDPMDVVKMFHEMPNNSIMSVFVDDDPMKMYYYRFSKGELVKSRKDSDIDLFSWSYV